MQSKNTKRITKTLNNKNMFKNNKYLISVMLLLCILRISCEKKHYSKTIMFDRKNSLLVDSLFCVNKLEEIIYNDSIVINREIGKRHFSNVFPIINNSVFDYRYSNSLDKKDIDTLLFFSKKDTIFDWRCQIEFPFVFGLNRSSTKVIIKKLSTNFFSTTLQSLQDTTYKEIYYYDEKYNIVKFEYFYKHNKITLK